MIGRITAFKKFVSLRFSKALQFYLCLPLSISDEIASLGLAGWGTGVGFMDSCSIVWAGYPQPCPFISCSEFLTWYIALQRLQSQWDTKDVCNDLDIICMDVCMQLVRYLLPDLGTVMVIKGETSLPTVKLSTWHFFCLIWIISQQNQENFFAPRYFLW